MRSLIFFQLAVISHALYELSVRSLEEQIGERPGTRTWLGVYSEGLLDKLGEKTFRRFVQNRNSPY